MSLVVIGWQAEYTLDRLPLYCRATFRLGLESITILVQVNSSQLHRLVPFMRHLQEDNQIGLEIIANFCKLKLSLSFHRTMANCSNKKKCYRAAKECFSFPQAEQKPSHSHKPYYLLLLISYFLYWCLVHLTCKTDLIIGGRQYASHTSNSKLQ